MTLHGRKSWQPWFRERVERVITIDGISINGGRTVTIDCADSETAFALFNDIANMAGLLRWRDTSSDENACATAAYRTIKDQS